MKIKFDYMLISSFMLGCATATTALGFWIKNTKKYILVKVPEDIDITRYIKS